MDRIYEAYSGEMGALFQKKVQERVHWLCSQAVGERVLDIGCSQGIGPVLLGRSGFQVVGVDINPEAIAFAAQKLLDESDSVRNRVDFICQDFLDFPAAESSFDTVIFGEVLEHLLQPEVFLKKAHSLLKNDGVLVVTVPFGINDDPDHKQTFYFAKLYRMISKYFSVHTVKLFGKWIGYVGCRRDYVCENVDCPSYDDLMYIEDGLYQLERGLLDANSAKTKAIEGHTANIKALQTQLQQRIDRLASFEKETAQLQAQLRQQEETASQLMSSLQQSIESAATLKEKLQQNRDLLQDKEAQLQDREAQLNQQAASLQEAQEYSQSLQKKLSAAEMQISSVSTQLKQRELEKKNIQQQYNLLANAKLGRLTRWYWKKKDAVLYQFRKGDPNAKTIRNFSKKIPGLRPLVFLLRKVRAFVSGAPAQPAAAVQKAKPVTKAKTRGPQVTGDEGYFDRIKERLSKIPESNGGRYYRPVSQKIGLICDPFYYDSVYAAADFVYISPDNWETAVKDIQILLVVSTWTGLHNEEWRGLSTEGSIKRNLLYQIIDHCRDNGIVTVFYSKEDPPHYKDYLGTAKKCEYIFTTAEEVIPNYKRDCGHDRVFSLRFGINPQYHNPVGIRSDKKEDAVIFSGSWMNEQPERCKDLASIFDGILASGKKLKVIDRMYKLHEDERYRLPDKYFRYASPSIGHDDLQKVHKLYNWAVNINTVKHSQTMFANRVYELQASGNLLLSNYSVGVNSLLPTVFMVHNSEDVGRIMNSFTPEEVYERQISGVRKVMTGETCYDRVAEMLQKIGVETEPQKRTVLVVAETLDQRTKEMFAHQSYPAKTLVSADDLCDELMAQYDIVAFFGANRKYGTFYLEDMVNGFKYTDCDYITKAGFVKNGTLHKGPEHTYVQEMGSKYRTVFWSKSFCAEQLQALSDNAKLPNGYSVDHFNYAEDESRPAEVRKPLLSVILPVYNNGWHLYGKAFASLRRSSLFSQMEILLIDDGSTDGFTPSMVTYLAEQYPNVRTYFFEAGGSGSASRPRNKGVALASAEHIVFFDPDDEAVQDTYASLYALAVRNNYDLVTSNRLKCVDAPVLFDYYYYFDQVYGKTTICDNAGDFLKKTKFTPVGIQAMVIKKSLIADNGLQQIPGAIGEDTLFSWQLLTAAKSIHATPLVSHLYYAAREGSVVNSIGTTFFKKHLICEPEILRWLQAKDLLLDYMQTRHEYYVKNWYFKKLADAKVSEREGCVKLLGEILSLYEDFYSGTDDAINEFVSLYKKGDYSGAYWLAQGLYAPQESNCTPDEGFYSRIESQVAAIPKSNGGRYYLPWRYRVGVISDDFLYNSYKDVADCVPLNPDNWKKELDSLDLFLLITGWKGLEQEWKDCSVEGSASRTLIYKIIDTCNEKGIPTVFYSIEDPPNYEVFLNVAKHCTYVFTTAEERVPDYKRDCGHDRVDVIRFGMNPLFHNPVGIRAFDKRNEVIFSGSWMKKYPERCRDMEMIFDGVLRSGKGLRVINRNFYIGNENYKFPARFLPYTSPAIAHENLQQVHKLYNWAINTNSVRESFTMFANRVYELQAAGNILLSNNNPGVNKWLPTIHLIQDSNEIPRILNAYTDEQLYERQITGVRFSMTGESSFDRFSKILQTLHLDAEVTQRKTAVIADKITPSLAEMFHAQSLQNCGLFEESSVTEADLASYDVLAFWNHKASYGEFYLEDMVNGFKYTACDYITKDAYVSAGTLHAGTEHNYVQWISDKYRTVFWKDAFSLDALLQLTAGPCENGYSADHFNYDAEPQKAIRQPQQYKLSVVIPMRNNGKQMYGKALASLMRCSCFRDMEILLVDGGSDDCLTDRLGAWLAARYPNIRMLSIRPEDGPFLPQARAAGAKQAAAPYVAFLNPENEILTDALSRMLEWAEADNADAVMGNQIHFCLHAVPRAPITQPCLKTDKAAVGTVLAQCGALGEMQNFIVRTSLLREKEISAFADAAVLLKNCVSLSVRPIDALMIYHEQEGTPI